MCEERIILMSREKANELANKYKNGARTIIPVVGMDDNYDDNNAEQVLTKINCEIIAAAYQGLFLINQTISIEHREYLEEKLNEADYTIDFNEEDDDTTKLNLIISFEDR